MRNLKKLLAVIVSVCVLATFTFPAFAAEKTAAEICEDLGVLKGDSSEGVTDTYLAKGTTRDQAAILYLRLIGKEDEAYAFEGEDNFADADQTWDNAKKALAYLKANPELGWQGVSEDKFDPKATISAQQMYKVCLEALGYKQGVDFEWAEVFTFAAEKGLTLIADVTAMTNNDVAIALVEALKLPLKGSETTLIEDLVAKGVVTEAAAIEAGLIEAEPEKLEVVSVEADNLVRVIVTFNKAIDDDSIDAGDFEVDGNDIDKDNVSWSDDKMVATLKTNPDDPMKNGDEIEIAISGITAVDGTELADYEGEFTPMDVVQPKVESIEFTGPETVKLTFSEPIDASGSDDAEVVIDGGIYSGSPAAGFDNKTDVTVNLGTELDEGEHTFKIKGFEDFAGYSNITTAITVEYAAIDEAPSVEVKKATQSYVVLKFERPVKDVEIDDFYQTYSNWKPLEVQNEDGDEELNDNDYYDVVRLAFTNAEKVTPSGADGADDNDKPLPVGTAKIIVKDESVEDRWGNKVDGDVTLTAEITADNTKPEITKIKVENEGLIKLYFSESVDAAEANDDSNYVIKDSKGKVISSTKWDAEDYDDDDKVVNIDFKDDLDKGKYTITAEAIPDTSIARNTLDTVTLDFEITDKSASLDDVTAAWVDASNVLYIKYGDEMDSVSVLDKENYRLLDDDFDGDEDTAGVQQAKLPDNTKLSMFTSKIVKIQFKQVAEGTADDFDLDNGSIIIGRVKDAAGNVVSAFSKTIVIDDELAPVVYKIKKIADNKFELTLNQELKSVDSGAISVAKDGDETNTSAASFKYTKDGNKTKIVVTVPSNQKDGNTLAVNDTYKIIVNDGKIKSVTGVAMPRTVIEAGVYDVDLNNDGDYTDDDEGENLTFTDGVAPELVKDSEDDKIVYAFDSDNNDKVDYFILKYSEAIDAGTISKYSYSVSGYKVEAVTVNNTAGDMNAVRSAITSTAAAGKYVIIRVEENDDTDIDQTPEVVQLQSIEDVAGNALEADDEGVEAVDEDTAEHRNPVF